MFLREGAIVLCLSMFSNTFQAQGTPDSKLVVLFYAVSLSPGTVFSITEVADHFLPPKRDILLTIIKLYWLIVYVRFFFQ